MRNKSRNVSEHYRVSLSQTGAGIADPAAGRIDTGLLKVSTFSTDKSQVVPRCGRNWCVHSGRPGRYRATRFHNRTPRTGAVSAQAIANRKVLVSAFAAQGMANYAREWWHYSLPGLENAPAYDVVIQ